MPDASNPDEMLQAVDYVFIQFFNNPPCGLEVTPNGVFTTSVGKWMAVLAKGNPAPKLYIGAPACPSCAGSGYLEAAGLKTAIANAKAANPGLDQMLGGIMLWDGSQALLNGQYTTAAMQALGS